MTDLRWHFCRCGGLLVMLVASIFVLIGTFASNSQVPVSFSCDGTVYYALNNVTPGKTQLVTYDLETSSFVPIGPPQPRHNALAFNPVDNLLYAMVPDRTEIYRIRPDGTILSISLPTGPNPGGTQWVSGTFLPDGKYVVARNPLDSGGGYLMVIDGIINNRPEVISGGPFEPDTTDMVYNSADGLIYSFDRREDVLQMMTLDPFAREYMHFGPVASDYPNATGGMAFAVDGTLLTIGQGQGEESAYYAIYSVEMNPGNPRLANSRSMI